MIRRAMRSGLAARLPTLAIALALTAAMAGCSEDPVAPVPVPELPDEDVSGVPARVLVVNTNSETLSSLDPATGVMTVQAGVLGTWTNRITAVPPGRRLLVTDSGDNAVEVLDALDLMPMGTVELGPGHNPWTAVAADRSLAVVANWLSGTVSLAHLADGSVDTPLPTTPGPEGVLVLDGLAWIACTNFVSDGAWGEGRVDVVDLSAGQVIASIAVGRNPREILAAPDGRLHVLCTGTYGRAGDPGGTVHVLDPVTRTDVDSVTIGGSPTRIASDDAGTMWAVGPSGGVRRWDATTLAPLPAPAGEFLRGPGLSAIDLDPDRDAAWITHFEEDLLLEVDPSTLEIRNVWLVGDGPVDVLSHDPAGTSGRN